MGAREFAGDAQAEAEAGRALVAAGAEKTLEDMLRAVGRNGRAGVPDGQRAAARVDPRGDADAAAGAIIFHRVLDHVLHDQADAPLIGDDREMRGEIGGNVQFMRLAERPRIVHPAVEQLAQIHRLAPQLDPARVRAREQQQVFRHRSQPVRLVQQIAHRLALARRRARIVEDFLEPKPQHRDRRFELMRGIGGKTDRLLEAALEPVERRIQHRDERAEFIARRRHRQPLVEPPRADLLRRFRDRLDGPQRAPPAPQRAAQNHHRHRRCGDRAGQLELPRERVDLLQIRADMEREIFMPKHPDAHRAPGDRARVEALDAVVQRVPAEIRRAINRLVVPPAQFDQPRAQREGHEFFRDLRAVVHRAALEVFEIAKKFARTDVEPPVERRDFIVAQKPAGTDRAREQRDRRDERGPKRELPAQRPAGHAGSRSAWAP